MLKTDEAPQWVVRAFARIEKAAREGSLGIVLSKNGFGDDCYCLAVIDRTDHYVPLTKLLPPAERNEVAPLKGVTLDGEMLNLQLDGSL
jgi:hypothetical protein